MTYYKFRDLERRPVERGLPPEALFIDNRPIEDLLDGYTTLNVQGRELLARNITTADLAGQDGKLFLSANYPERNIKVTYRLYADTDQEFREKFEYLNYLLSQKEFRFTFYDDPLFEWQGTVSSVEDVQAGINRIKSSFTITCSSPFKRRIQPVTFSNQHDGVVRISEPIYFPTLPDQIKVVIRTKTNHVAIKSPRNAITLSGDFNDGDVIRLVPSDDAKKDSAIYFNEKLDNSLLDLTSDFENFEIKYQDLISCDNQRAELYLTVRSKRL